MNIREAKDRSPLLIGQLTELWERSVRATHLFLSAEEIEAIKAYVPQALESAAKSWKCCLPPPRSAARGWAGGWSRMGSRSMRCGS